MLGNMSDSTLWYKHAVIYQIYPRSFKDSNGDGVGDIPGIISKLDYLQALGVDGIWLSPVYLSPMADLGYDVQDYRQIDPLFGTMADFDELLRQAHARGIKILMDLVANHTSKDHEWFQESKSSRHNIKRNWYIWKDPLPDGGPPNNWQSVFGGPAWTLDFTTNQYYLHSFLKEQPDLNWELEEVKDAIRDIMKFWYDKGVDGFRVDAILFTSKDLNFKDNFPTAAVDPNAASKEILDVEMETAFDHVVGTHLPDYISILSRVTRSYPGRCLFLEAYPSHGGPLGYAKLYDYMDVHVAAPFYFGFLGAIEGEGAKKFEYIENEFLAALGPDSTPAYVTGNHDMMRIATRIGQPAARMAAVGLLTLPGTKFIYYGEELGMENVAIHTPGIHKASFEARDSGRTPMQWDSTNNAGFSDGTAWLPVAQNYKEQNVAAMSDDATSILSLYKALLKAKRDYPALDTGTYRPAGIKEANIYGYYRELDDQKVLVVINFSLKHTVFGVSAEYATVLASTHMDNIGLSVDLSTIAIRPHEAFVLLVTD